MISSHSHNQFWLWPLTWLCYRHRIMISHTHYYKYHKLNGICALSKLHSCYEIKDCLDIVIVKKKAPKSPSWAPASPGIPLHRGAILCLSEMPWCWRDVLIIMTLWAFNNLISRLVMEDANDIDSRWWLSLLKPTLAQCVHWLLPAQSRCSHPSWQAPCAVLDLLLLFRTDTGGSMAELWDMIKTWQGKTSNDHDTCTFRGAAK